MITCDESGSIVVKIDDAAYDLSNSEQYADFLFWVTSPEKNAVPDEGATPDENAAPDDNEMPDKKPTIDDDVFKVDDNIPKEYRAKASRYAEFLIEYAHRRQDKLAEMAKTLPTEQREKEIQAFIKRLKGEEA
ncbi:hypothetical protein [Curtanaerobium respiraculi]|uniref:hypothetical protein n=1 Tax=Curtanaerobium respiraculi TaxID=2949669 RepID=UPI0024B3B427|nr:hypothetical protein [Curtanaerobium respiraculi]